MDAMVLILAPIVLVSFTTEAAVGFGSTVMALAVGSHFYAVGELLPVIVPLNLALSTYRVARHGRRVAWRVVATRILPLMTLGVAFGLALFYGLSGTAMKSALGILVVGLSAHELLKLSGALHAPATPMRGSTRAACLLGAGIIHGIYASGGPLLVYTLGRSKLGKSEFRSTLGAVWLVLDGVLLTAYLVGGRISGARLGRSAALVPVIALAIVLGEWGHRRVNERLFRLCVFSLLLLVGGSLVG